MPKWPIDPSKAWQAWKDVSASADTSVNLVLAGDDGLVRSAYAVFGSPVAGHPRVVPESTTVLQGGALGVGELVVLLVQPHREGEALAVLDNLALPTGAIVAVDDGPAASFQVSWPRDSVARVSFADTETGWDLLAKTVVEVAEEHSVALARRHPVLRDRAADRVIRRTSQQNALIGVAFVLPGTDMPLMTLNQIKMVLALAAIYGEEISKERAIELLGVVGIGFAFRTAARQVVDFVPGTGWALKGAIGYSGTLAMGEGAQKYFQGGAPATPSRLKGLVQRVRR